MGEHDEFIADFLEECDENLDQLDQELVALEENPRDEGRLRSIFRSVHTIKGSSGFFGFAKIGSLSHEGETLLGRLRDGELIFNRDIASGLLAMSDAIRELLSSIEQTGLEGEKDYSSVHDILVALSNIEVADPSSRSLGEGAAAGSETQQTARQADSNHEIQPIDLGEDAIDADAVEVTNCIQEAGSIDIGGVEESIDTSINVVPVDAYPDSTSDEAVALATDGQHPEKSDERPTEFSVESQSKAGKQTGGGVEPTTIRVDVDLLDQLMDLAGELVLARNSLNRCGDKTHDPRLATVASRISQITTDIQDRVTQTRMLPIGGIWGRFRRIVRDLAIDCGKNVRLELQGEETELDRSLIEAVKDPLTHLIRNSVDHGIENPLDRISAGKNAEGVVKLHARHEQGQVVIEIVDDGAGIDVEKILNKAIARKLISLEDATALSQQDILQFIFEAGFSTAEKVSAISGRGVGMDVVRSHVEKIGGTVQIESRLGVGTTFTIRLPLTLAIVPALVLKVSDQLFAVPQATFAEVVTLGSATKVEWIHDIPVCRLRGQLLPLVWLDQFLGIQRHGHQSDNARFARSQNSQIAILQVDQMRFGLVMDEVVSSQEIVVKPIGGAVKAIGAYSAATILGDGIVALILDVSGIARLAGLSAEMHGRLQESDLSLKPGADGKTPLDHGEQPKGVTSKSQEKSYLICEVDGGREVAIAMDLVERLEDVTVESLQRFDTKYVTNYRGKVLQIRSLFASDVTETSDGRKKFAKATTPLVICKYSGSQFGLLVQQILDVVNISEEIQDQSTSTPPLEKESDSDRFTLVNGKVVEVVDLERECHLALGVGG